MQPLLLLQAPPAPTGTTQSADDRSQAFKPVTGAPEMQSGERLLVIAYMAIWLCVVVLIVLSYVKQVRLDQRIAALGSALERARRDRPSPPSKTDSDGDA
ncbi:MAG: hypothetical protein R3B70_27620 [Polyangiaceae bacterium]